MKNFLLIGFTDAKLFLRDKTSYVWLLLMPLVFAGLMGFMVREPGGPNVAHPSVMITNEDQGFLGRVFLRELGDQGLRIVGPDNRADATRGLTIPADFTERILALKQSRLDFFKVAKSDDEESFLVEARLARAVVAMNGHLIEHAGLYPGSPLTEASLNTILDQPDKVTLESSFAGRKPRPVGFAFSLPGNLVMYLFMNTMIFGGAVVAQQRRTGVFRRMAINPTTSFELLFGKIFGLMLLAAVQIAFLLAVGQFALGVDIAHNLPGILLTLAVFSWVAASMGVLVGFLVTAEEKVIGICLAIALPSAALGGCWWPLEFAPSFLQNAALFVPTGWALQALHQLITFGASTSQVVTPLLALTAFALAANILAAKFYRV